MFTNSKIAKSVKLGLLIGSASVALTTTQAVAQQAGADTIEKIQVTGSRIKRTDLEGSTPITSITAEDIKLEGDYSVADALRSSSFNSFGSFSERSGSSAQSQATINLRGAGSARTLVLLNGRRFPGSPTLGGSSANLNAIPFAMVERIDIMTGGASSVYGSDAMAGVVNVILKDEFEGLTFSGGVGMRTQDEGTTSSEFSVIGGLSNDKGSITWAFDHQKREGISDAARPYTQAVAEDRDGDGIIQAYSETSGWSLFGASIIAPDFSITTASPLCGDLIDQYGADTFAEVRADVDWGPGSTYCMYAFANVSYNTASLDRNTLYLNTNYEITDDVEFFGQAMFTENSSFGRYAPPAANWFNMSADNPHNPYGVDGVRGLFRWVGIGTRDGNVYDYNQDYTLGFRGDLDWANASWEVYYHNNYADNKAVGEYYLSFGGLAYNEANDIDLASEEGQANLSATTLQQSSAGFDQIFAGMSFDMFELGGGDAAHYIGTEFMDFTYADIYDGQSEAGLIGGSAGNSAQGERDVFAVFYEGLFPVTDQVEVNVAVRYDDYSDVGDNIAPSISVRYEPIDSLILRASYSESFRAPGLDDLNAATTFSAEAATDLFTDPTNTVSRQVNTFIKSNKDLTPETSEYFNLGLAYDITDNVGITLDYFNLSIDNVIQQKSVNDLIFDEQAGLITAVSPETDVSDLTFYLMRGATGVLIEAGTGQFNGIGFEVEGIDFALNGLLETEFGDFRVNSTTSYVLSYDQEVAGVIQNTVSWNGQPEFKNVTTFSWMMGDHSASWNISYTDSTSENETAAGVQSGTLDSWLLHNVTYGYNMGDFGALRLTVNNLLDEDPVLTSQGTWDNQDLYNNFGRDVRLNYTISF